MTDVNNENSAEDGLRDQKLGALISSSLYKLEYISDHHVKERRKSFRITNIFVMVVSAFIFIIAAANLYNLNGFYDETLIIVDTVRELDNTVDVIADNMVSVTGSMKEISRHVGHMEGIYSDVSSIASVLPLMQGSMTLIGNDMGRVNPSMKGMSQDMNVVGFHLNNMSINVSRIRYSVHQMADPMGKFNSILP